MRFPVILVLICLVLPANKASAWFYSHEGVAAAVVLLLTDGDVISGGAQTDAAGLVEMVALRHSAADGSEKWRYVIHSGGPIYQSSVSLAQDNAGAIFAASFQRERYGAYTGVVVKISSTDGRELWRQTVEAGFMRIAVDSNGDLLAVGI